MKHFHAISRTPALGSTTLTADMILQFVITMLGAFRTLLPALKTTTTT